MRYLVKATATAARADEIDAKGGPGPVFAYIAQRFKPEAFYGNPTRRQVFLIVDLPTEADAAELMYTLAWLAGADPEFTPIMAPELFDQAIAAAKKAPSI